MAGGISAKKEPQIIGLTDAQLRAVVEDVDPELIRIGHEVVARQKQETFREAWRNHWGAGMWSFVLSCALFMEGYDTGLISTFYGMPQFQDRFGSLHKGKMVIPASYQGALLNLGKVGQLCGLIITGVCQERYGSKKTYIWGMAAMTASIFLAVFAVNINMLVGAELAMGIPWGMFQTLATAYAAEICPIKMRGYLAAFASVGWGGGGFLASGVLKGALHLKGDLAWKVPFALQWVWPVPLAFACFFAPESAWWLVRKGRFDDAKATLLRTAKTNFYAENEAEGYIAYMRHTDAMEKLEAKNGSWLELFRKGPPLRRTEIMIGTWVVQVANGNMITGLTVEFLKQAGMSTKEAFNMNLILHAMGIVGVGLSWIFLGYFGRRPIYLSGLVTEACCLLPIGILGFVTKTNATLKLTGALMIMINLIFHFSLGPVCYSIVGELPASRLRSRAIVMGRFIYVVMAIVFQQINTRMVAADGWNLKAKSGLFWVGCNFVCLTWAFFRLPETGGRSFAELDILFANKVPARKFAKTIVRDEAAEYGVQGKEAVDVVHDEKEAVEDVQIEDASGNGRTTTHTLT
ncbi:uncharacterized protein I303_101919 [Kwoniella dejecticola CBS 10117]|uniref:Major facilitator superfamily (MFS) profile domain-containing protein n=1 Tax=Kwoniella dejecticola CBS 10117 TaxID=1296121 RepID=A0A1A6ACG6_9TREE|nr:uncharacterized protein I303_01945 [Kwoniella dejecticola CBS 10117]OBR87733.1 hypothetical protein I303_01945 [Kwoniella dejecticola CBS 10117]